MDPGHESRLLAYITVERILDGLQPADAELLRWRFAREMSVREIAERLEITEDAAEKRIHRALTKTRGLLKIQRGR